MQFLGFLCCHLGKVVASGGIDNAARGVDQQTATDNADELLRQLNLQYNKSRQQAITSELLDIVGGSVNN